MTDQQENQLLIILSDLVPVMEGDVITGISPEAEELTRQKVLDQLVADKAHFDPEDLSLIGWQEENIQLLKSISDEEFQTVVQEKIRLTELQIGQSLFEPLSDTQLEKLAEKLNLKQTSPYENQETSEEKSEKKGIFFSRFFKTNR